MASGIDMPTGGGGTDAAPQRPGSHETTRGTRAAAAAAAAAAPGPGAADRVAAELHGAIGGASVAPSLAVNAVSFTTVGEGMGAIAGTAVHYCKLSATGWRTAVHTIPRLILPYFSGPVLNALQLL